MLQGMSGELDIGRDVCGLYYVVSTCVTRTAKWAASVQ
jgi:hypothetical protein